jgi:hypothetical protein
MDIFPNACFPYEVLNVVMAAGWFVGTTEAETSSQSMNCEHCGRQGLAHSLVVQMAIPGQGVNLRAVQDVSIPHFPFHGGKWH